MGGVEDSQLISDVQRLTDSLGELPEPVVRPTFIAVSGLPGTGKSYFCSKLVERLPLVILESDALRKTLFPSPSYNSPESSHLFRALHLLIERLLSKGISLILDATNLSERYRERLYNIADRLEVKLILVRVEAPPEVVYERLKNRQEGANPEDKSDADWKVYQRMKSSVQKIHRNHYAVDTSRDITPVLGKIVREARR
jgi:predicted kinase